MFEVVEKETGKRRLVYGVSRTDGVKNVWFLVYNKHFGWVWSDASVYKPVKRVKQ